VVISAVVQHGTVGEAVRMEHGTDMTGEDRDVRSVIVQPETATWSMPRSPLLGLGTKVLLLV
jgi:hypothetical protein